jgi:hypothetical protein
MIRLLEQVLGDAEAVKDFDRPGLHAVGLADLERAVAALEDPVVDAEAGEPDGGAQAGRATAADQHVDLFGFGRHCGSCGVGWCYRSGGATV